VTILIISGSPGAIGAHDPTVCYGGAGFKQKSAEKTVSVTTKDGKVDSLWGAKFDKETFPVQSLQVNWAWTVNGQWQASGNPRIEYARHSMLYKIYVSRGLGPNLSEDRDPSVEFMKELLPEIRKTF
jgi:hypothetical protein